MDFRLLQKSEVLLSALMQVYELYTEPRSVRRLAALRRVRKIVKSDC
jgi:hypothetical protein